MRQAAQSRGVPLAVVEATAYVNTRWEWIATPSITGGVGPMNISPTQIAQASALSGHTQAEITGDVAANLDAGAALIAHYHTTGTDLASWKPAVATVQGPVVAREIFSVIASGATRTTSTGETIGLAPQPLSPTNTSGTTGGASSVGGTAGTATAASPDYPSASWVPADPSNYTVANRTHDYPIDLIIVHDIEGSAGSAIQVFQTPGYAASAHYVVDYNGAITQMVLEKDVAWHAGNWDYNTRAIGIEHAGFASQNLYTYPEYDNSAMLAASICSRYGVPLDRNHVIGHYQVPDPNNPSLFGGSDHHTDPGPYWNWTYYMSQAQKDAATMPSPPHMMSVPTIVPMNVGATISWVGQTCHLPIASYTVTVQPGNITINLPGTASSTTVTGLTNGTTYTATVTATNADGTDSNSTTLIPSGPCTSPTLTATPASTGPTGGSIVFHASTSGCTNPTYKFWILPPGGSWEVARWYGTSSSFTWTDTSVAGAYRAEVDVRQQSSSVDYDATTNIPYSLVGCASANLGASPTSPQPPGTAVTLTAGSSCLGTPSYRFWIRPPGGSWGIVQDYGASATYAWNTTGKAQGTYSLEVDVRNAGSAAPYEAVHNTTYVLGPAACHGATLTANPASPGATGASITFTGGSTGCPNPRYRFWMAAPGGAWSVVQNYGSASTYNWSATGAPGTYRFEVDVKDASSSATYDTVSNLSYTLAGCSSAQLATDKSSPQLVGTASVTLTATASCPGTPDYRFWVRAPGGAWTVVQNYGPTATYTWNTASLGAGTYYLEVDVRDHGSTASYEKVANAAFTFARCTAPTLTSDKASPQTAGTTITFSAAASCTGTPQYRFWVKGPGGAWTIARDYSTTATFAWNTAGKAAGTYAIEADVRNAGSTVSYEAVSNSTYTLS